LFENTAPLDSNLIKAKIGVSQDKIQITNKEKRISVRLKNFTNGSSKTVLCKDRTGKKS
jgi:hypothetical protein